MFGLPLAAAVWLYASGSALAPRARVNYGELIEPPRSLPEPALATAAGTPAGRRGLRGRWSLVYVASGPCGANCRGALAVTRAVRLALGRDRERVQRVLLGAAGCCDARALAAENPDLWIAAPDGDAGTRLAASFAGAAGSAAGGGRLYLVDPLGNLMMRFPADAARAGLLRDLERLLGLSQIG